MRNLALVDRNVVSCSLLSNCQTATIEASALYFVSGGDLCKLDLHLSNSNEEQVEILAPLDSETVLDVKYLPEENVLVLVSEGGSVATFNIDSSTNEVVGDVAGGISSCGWSPDMETLALVTKTGNILLMTRTWDVLSEVPLFQNDFGEGKFVTVGWGKKETQFHGSEGKDSRVKREVQGKLADWDDQKPRIVWRADGFYFAINSVDPSLGHRSIRVFDREGQLQFTSETVEQLEQSLSWKSSGASGLISSSISLVQQGKQQVAFFEKNGLRHGEFNVSPGSKVLELFWNGDSTVLAAIIELDSKRNEIQLWTSSNYHWSLKQVIPFEDGYRPLWLSWDCIEANRLHLVSSLGQYVCMDYQLVVDGSRGLSSSDMACVAVIDNCNLKVTLLREAVIPPPMCAWQLEMPQSINQVTFQTADSNQLSVLTKCGRVDCFKLTHSDELSKDNGVKIVRKEGRNCRPILLASYSLDGEVAADFYHWKWIDDDVMVACRMNQLLILHLRDGVVALKKCLQLEQRVGSLVVSRDCGIVVVHLVDGRIFHLTLRDMELIQPESVPVISQFCSQTDYVRGHWIGLSTNGRLYCDGKEMLNAVSSFAVHSDFLLVTSVQNHQLVCIALADLQSFAVNCCCQRRIERGAKLVHSVAAATTVVLQMPRGNTEAVHPRSLILNILSTLITEKRYAEAFDLMKKQRINLNLLVDYDPHRWLENCAEFIELVGRRGMANLNLFLSELQDDDFTITMYGDYFRGRSNPPLESKVDTICQRMRKTMEDTDNVRYLLPILTSHVRQGQIHLALKAVQPISTEALKDEALKYLAVLVDASKLYTEALATYDIQLTLMVANRSQMDPKEYLPFLNQLEAMDDAHLRRFTIDNWLKRYEPAVVHLCRCRPVRTAEIISFMKMHRIYAPVIDELCPLDVAEVADVLHSAANWLAETLASRSNYEEAAYVYQRVGLDRKALSAFQMAGLWNQCLTLASRLNLEERESREVMEGLVKQLRTMRRHREAAAICELHLTDLSQSVQCLVDGLCFSDAWSLTLRHSLSELQETILKPALMEAVQSTTERMQQVRNECGHYVTRLLTVRRNLTDRLDKPPPETEHGDLFSETGSSIFSGSGTSGTSASGRTLRSSRNRRKHERKKLQLKEGGAFEDLAIINQLHHIYVSIDSLLDDIGSVLRGGLLILRDWQPLRQLQSDCDSLVKFLEAKKKDIWNFQSLKKDDDSQQTYGPSSTTEAIISQLHKSKEEYFAGRYMELEPKMRYGPDISADSWKLDLLK